VKSDTLSTLPAYASSGTITVDQMYVRYQVPVGTLGIPIILIHGCCLTGKTWETTPDGRMGWDEYFVRHSHPTYVIDQVWRGRSAADPSAINAVRSGKTAVDQLPTAFSAGHESAWAIFRFGKEYPQTMPGMRYPIAAQAEFWKQMVPDSLNSLPTPNPTVPALSELAQKIGGTVLMSHSQSGIYPFQTAALSRKGIAPTCRFWCCSAITSINFRAGRRGWRTAAPSSPPPMPRAAKRSCWCCPTLVSRATRTC
jgi:hypothetical protein